MIEVTSKRNARGERVAGLAVPRKFDVDETRRKLIGWLEDNTSFRISSAPFPQEFALLFQVLIALVYVSERAIRSGRPKPFGETETEVHPAIKVKNRAMVQVMNRVESFLARRREAKRDEALESALSNGDFAALFANAPWDLRDEDMALLNEGLSQIRSLIAAMIRYWKPKRQSAPYQAEPLEMKIDAIGGALLILEAAEEELRKYRPLDEWLKEYRKARRILERSGKELVGLLKKQPANHEQIAGSTRTLIDDLEDLLRGTEDLESTRRAEITLTSDPREDVLHNQISLRLADGGFEAAEIAALIVPKETPQGSSSGRVARSIARAKGKTLLKNL